VLYQLSYASEVRSPVENGRSKPEASRFRFAMSGRRDSNPRPTAWKAVTLPTELLPQRSTFHDLCLPDDNRQDCIGGGQGRIRTSEGARPTDLQSVAFDRFATCPTGFMETQDPAPGPDIAIFKSWRWDSNPQPADYKQHDRQLTTAWQRSSELAVGIEPTTY
jgi:hypothetical protein